MAKKQINPMEINENAKMKKKIKITKKKLILNKEYINKSIQYFKNKGQLAKGNIYIYLILKSEIEDSQSAKNLKNKLISLKHSLSSKTCIIDNDLSLKEKEHLLTIDNQLKVISIEEMKNKINQLRKNDIPVNQLNYIYSIFLIDVKLNSHLKEYSNDIDICFYNNMKKKNYLENIVERVNKGASLLKRIKTNRIFKVKCSSVNMDSNQIKDNIQTIIYEGTSYILAHSQKHNGIECIVLKTEDSIPLTIYGTIPSECIDLI